MRISDWSSDVCSSDLILTLRAAPDLPDLRCDARKLKQVLVNLLSNAVKFTPAGGRILLEATTDGADGIVIEVADTGIGIATERSAERRLGKECLSTFRSRRSPSN